MSWHEPGKDGYYKPKPKRTKHIIVIVVIIVACAILDYAIYF